VNRGIIGQMVLGVKGKCRNSEDEKMRSLDGKKA
jgi:hypothetical protein